MPEPSLRELQRWMVSRILPPERAAGATAQVGLHPQGGDPGAERLSVYSGGYRARIEEALKEVYPAVRHVAGANTFHALAHDYASRYASRSYNLSRAGRALPEFLQTHELGKELVFLSDLARLEWEVAESFHAFDVSPIDPSRLSALPPEDWARARLIFQPSVRLVRSSWPVLEIWEARNQPISEVRIDLAGRPQQVMISRSAFQVRCEFLEEKQFQLLQGLLAGKRLEEVCGELLDSAGGEEPPIADWFSLWAAAGLVVNINLA